MATIRPEKHTDTGEQGTSLNLPFRELIQKVREFLSSPDSAAGEDYYLGSALGCNSLLLQQKKSDRSPSIELSIVADIPHLQSPKMNWSSPAPEALWI